MQILGIGLSKTGTISLHRALGILGYKCLHYDDKRLNDILGRLYSNPRFQTLR